MNPSGTFSLSAHDSSFPTDLPVSMEEAAFAYGPAFSWREAGVARSGVVVAGGLLALFAANVAGMSHGPATEIAWIVIKSVTATAALAGCYFLAAKNLFDARKAPRCWHCRQPIRGIELLSLQAHYTCHGSRADAECPHCGETL